MQNRDICGHICFTPNALFVTPYSPAMPSLRGIPGGALCHAAGGFLAGYIADKCRAVYFGMAGPELTRSTPDFSRRLGNAVGVVVRSKLSA